VRVVACVFEGMPCGVEMQWFDRVPVIESGESQRVFDVALWRWWPSLFPEYTAFVVASNAFAAVACLMRVSRVRWVARAAAATLDGSLVYHAIEVRLGDAGQHGGRRA
jgi:hypothetical protein